MKNKKALSIAFYTLIFGWILLLIFILLQTIIPNFSKTISMIIFYTGIFIVILSSIVVSNFLANIVYWNNIKELDELINKNRTKQYELNIVLEIVREATFSKFVITEKEFTKEFNKKFIKYL